MYAFGSGRLGIVARNLFEPEFDFGDESALTLKRQVRIGAALTPGRHGAAAGAATTVAIDLDLTRTRRVGR